MLANVEDILMAIAYFALFRIQRGLSRFVRYWQ